MSRRGAPWLALALCLMGSVQAQPRSGVAPIAHALESGEVDEDLTPGQRADPWEPFNRAMFRFNQDLDQGALLPWADAYVTLVPELLRIGIGNFFANAQDLWSAANNLLQAKLDRSLMMTMRFAVNSTFGALGLIDVAGAVGIPRTPEDFGQTLAVWGMPAGPYLVLPLFGPSTVRDALGLPLDLIASPYYAVNQGSFRPVTTLLGVINTRAELLPATRALDEIALDKYTFVRDVYLQRRLKQVHDGDVPEDQNPDVPAVEDGAGDPKAPAAAPR